MKSHSIMPAPPDFLDKLTRRYGQLVTFQEVAIALRYPTISAARQANNRGTFPIRLVRVGSQRGLVASVQTLADYLWELQERVRLEGGSHSSAGEGGEAMKNEA